MAENTLTLAGQPKAYAYKDLRDPLGRALMSVGQEINDLMNRIAWHKNEARNLEARLTAKQPLYNDLRQQYNDANKFVSDQYEAQKDGN